MLYALPYPWGDILQWLELCLWEMTGKWSVWKKKWHHLRNTNVGAWATVLPTHRVTTMSMRHFDPGATETCLMQACVDGKLHPFQRGGRTQHWGLAGSLNLLHEWI